AGATRGVVVAALATDWVKEIAARYRRGATGYVFVATKSGTPLAHNDSEFVRRTNDLSQLPDWTQLTARTFGTLDGFFGTEGRPLLLSFNTVPDAGWKVWARREQADIESRVWEAYSNVSIWAFLAVAAALV